MTEAADFGQVSTYVTFIGNGRTGTSLVAAMIDAHEHAILSHQLRAMRLIRRLSRNELFALIIAASKRHAKNGKKHYQYRYTIPGTWQGRYSTLRLIGDKYAGPDTDRFGKNGYALLEHLGEKMAGLELKFVHMVRNPYDSIATHKKRYYTTLRRAMATCFRREAIVHEIRDRGYDVHDLWHEQMLALLGVRQAPAEALHSYELVRDALPPDYRAFWDAHRALIRRGLVGQGRMIQFISWVRRIVGVVAGRAALSDLRAVATPTEGRAFYRRHIRSRRVRLLLHLAFNRHVMATFYRRRLYRLPAGTTPLEYVDGLVERTLERVPVVGNPYLHPFLFGEYEPDALPTYLQPVHFETLARRADRVHLVCTELMNHLRAQPVGHFDAIDLSNVIDWCSNEQRLELFAEVTRVGRPGARVLLFTRAEAPTVPADLAGSLEADEALGQELPELDRSAYYRSICLWRVTGVSRHG